MYKINNNKNRQSYLYVQIFSIRRVLTNIVSYLKNIKLHILIIGLCSIVTCVSYTSCGNSNNKSSVYRNTEDAIKAYTRFWSELCSLDEVTTDELCDEVKKWIMIDTVVTRYVYEPGKKESCSYCIKDYENTRDSIELQFNRLILTGKRTYKDVIFLMEAASPFIGDASLDSVMDKSKPFFDALQVDTITNLLSPEIELSKYRRFLKRQIAKGIHNKDDMLAFIKNEDKHYREFLMYMDDLKDENTNDIVYSTERCCQMVFKSASKGEINELEALVFMTIRNNHRLLQNALICIDNIKSGNVTTIKQAKTYALMILKPYVSMSAVSIALLYPSDRAELLSITEQTDSVISSLHNFTEWDDKTISVLPYILMNMVISNTK